MRPSRMIVHRIRDAKALCSFVEATKDLAAEGLTDLLESELASGESLPDYSLSLELMGRAVESAMQRLETADVAYIRAQKSTAITRRLATKLARKVVYPKVVAVRRSIDAHFGRARGVEVHGMQGKTLRKPRRLQEQLTFLMRALQAPRSEMPESLLFGIEASCETWLEQLEPGYRELTELVDQLAKFEVDEEDAKLHKNATMEEFDQIYGQALRVVQATYHFAGCDEKLTRTARSYWRRRLLNRRAREAKEARQARPRTPGEALRSVASSVIEWIGPKPPSVA